MYSLHIFIDVESRFAGHGFILMTGNCSIQALIFCFPPFFREHTTNEKIFENRLSDIEFNIPLKKFSITNQGHLSWYLFSSAKNKQTRNRKIEFLKNFSVNFYGERRYDSWFSLIVWQSIQNLEWRKTGLALHQNLIYIQE